MNYQDVPTLTFIGSTMRTHLKLKQIILCALIFTSSLCFAADTYKVDLSTLPFEQAVDDIQQSVNDLSDSLGADNVQFMVIHNNQILVTLRSYDDTVTSNGQMTGYILNSLNDGQYKLMIMMYGARSLLANFDVSINKDSSSTSDSTTADTGSSGGSSTGDSSSDTTDTTGSGTDSGQDQVADSGSSDSSDSGSSDSTDNTNPSEPSGSTPTIVASTDMISLSWDIPTSRADGDALSMSDIQYYEIYHTYNVGTPEEGSQVITVTDPNQTSFEVAASQLPKGLHQVAIAVVDTNQLRSQVSDTISMTIN